MNWLGRKILWLRAKEYLTRYHPLVIGVTGGTESAVTAHALGEMLSADRHVRSVSEPFTRPEALATDILGLESAARRHLSWRRLLVGSRLKELAENEPDTFIIHYPSPQPNQVDIISRSLPFTMGIITGVPSAHLDLYSTPGLVAHELLSLGVCLPAGGLAVINQDDPLLWPLPATISAQVVTFGTHPSATIYLRRLNFIGAAQGCAGEVVVDGVAHELFVPQGISALHVKALLPVIAITRALKLPITDTLRYLTTWRPPAGHMTWHAGKKGARLLDDSYDAHPEDTLAALDTLRQITTRRRIVILGELSGLGATQKRWHEKIGEALTHSAHVVILVGDTLRDVGKYVLSRGVDVHHFANSYDVSKWLADMIHDGDVVLIKGGYQVALEKVVHRLAANPDHIAAQLARSVTS